jgi:hypothetical protein
MHVRLHLIKPSQNSYLASLGAGTHRRASSFLTSCEALTIASEISRSSVCALLRALGEAISSQTTVSSRRSSLRSKEILTSSSWSSMNQLYGHSRRFAPLGCDVLGQVSTRHRRTITECFRRALGLEQRLSNSVRSFEWPQPNMAASKLCLFDGLLIIIPHRVQFV